MGKVEDKLAVSMVLKHGRVEALRIASTRCSRALFAMVADKPGAETEHKHWLDILNAIMDLPKG